MITLIIKVRLIIGLSKAYVRVILVARGPERGFVLGLSGLEQGRGISDAGELFGQEKICCPEFRVKIFGQSKQRHLVIHFQKERIIVFDSSHDETGEYSYNAIVTDGSL
jgi:hypothetical protein